VNRLNRRTTRGGAADRRQELSLLHLIRVGAKTGLAIAAHPQVQRFSVSVIRKIVLDFAKHAPKFRYSTTRSRRASGAPVASCWRMVSSPKITPLINRAARGAVNNISPQVRPHRSVEMPGSSKRQVKVGTDSSTARTRPSGSGLPRSVDCGSCRKISVPVATPKLPAVLTSALIWISAAPLVSRSHL
jgi:hypothetical protein